MTVTTKEFDSYVIKYSSYRVTADNRTFAFITCFKGNLKIGNIHFSEDHPLNENYLQDDKIYMRVDFSHFNDIINVLRYEKPLRMRFDDTKKEAWVSTGSVEPIGEQEGV
jgi:hypothetical protein